MPRHPWTNDAEYNAAWVARVKARCIIDEKTGCWLWTGALAINGYGQTCYRSSGCVLHRRMYEVARGVRLDRWQYACHTCDVRRCCNPDHVWIGTPKENQQDMSRKGRADGQWKTSCKYGHPFTQENTRRYPSTGRRHCVTCARIRCRIKAGWPKEMAETLGVTPKGHRPMNGKFPRRRKTSEVS